ncbi:hypothetical protein BBJ28_00022598 [Nothophytophthora sp. Chile5]|nr:hypothetical protein BBJ28_00022598 [Nothophytophthora sp. Chile5]
MELEKELVRALLPLALGGVPDSAITSLFDTGGTAALREEFVANALRLNVRDVYANLGDSEKRHALLSALVAAKVYLAWLQLSGGSAYGLFMPYVYRQVLDLLKKGGLNGRQGSSRQPLYSSASEERVNATAAAPDNEGTASAMTKKMLELLEALVSGAHGDTLQIARVIIHCYIPGITYQEMVAKENSSSLRTA